MRVLVSGAGGLIGQRLVPALQGAGHQVGRLVRGQTATAEGDVVWSPGRGTLDTAGLEGLDGVVHLAGEPILGRWTAAKRARIRDSRVAGTTLLAQSLAGLARKPRVLVCASASGYYGNRGEELLTEESAPGTGFLADVCREWEAARRSPRGGPGCVSCTCGLASRWRDTADCWGRCCSRFALAGGADRSRHGVLELDRDRRSGGRVPVRARISQSRGSGQCGGAQSRDQRGVRPDVGPRTVPAGVGAGPARGAAPRLWEGCGGRSDAGERPARSRSSARRGVSFWLSRVGRRAATRPAADSR